MPEEGGRETGGGGAQKLKRAALIFGNGFDSLRFPGFPYNGTGGWQGGKAEAKGHHLTENGGNSNRSHRFSRPGKWRLESGGGRVTLC